MRLSIDEYCNKFNTSKEIVHQKLRSRELSYIIEDNTIYIITPKDSYNSLNENSKHYHKNEFYEVPSLTESHKTTVAMLINLYQKENTQLKSKIKQLEEKIDRLVNDKEQMLIAERNKIEEIYTAKDEQLKNILEMIQTKLLLNNESQSKIVHDFVDIDVSQNSQNTYTEENKHSSFGLLELKRYLKLMGLGAEQRKWIKRKFENLYGSDIRIIQKEGIFYVDLSKYDYTDLLI